MSRWCSEDPDAKGVVAAVLLTTVETKSPRPAIIRAIRYSRVPVVLVSVAL